MNLFKVGISLLGGLWLAWPGAATGAEPAQPGGRPLLLAHVMPWYEADLAKGAWGWHWTMNHFDPNRPAPDGRRPIASQLYPSIGPYDSLDPAVLEYQVLLMKVAGIDGAILDWYGTDDLNDYPGIHRRTLGLIAALKRHGLRFAICYEDRVIKAAAEQRKLTPGQALARGEAHLRFCQEHWFHDPAYVSWDGKPLLMVFGPDYLEPTQWEAIFRKLDPAPAFFTLDERKGPAVGSFAWPPMWASRDGVLAPEALGGYLDRFAGQGNPKIPCAFPGFHDIYAEAKVRPSYGFLDARDGRTFRETLERALRVGGPVVQLATWNDYGEGTVLEPTREAGGRYLEAVQEARRRLDGGSFPFQPDDLKLPGRIHDLRSHLPPGSPDRARLDGAAADLAAGQPARARVELGRIGVGPAAAGSPPAAR